MRHTSAAAFVRSSTAEGFSINNAGHFDPAAEDAARMQAADHAGLKRMLQAAVAAHWTHMLNRTTDLGRNFTHIERILEHMAQKGADAEKAAASGIIAFINEKADPADIYRPRLKNYVLRGLPCIMKICRTYGFDRPALTVSAIAADIRRTKAADRGWKNAASPR